jgi:predicted nucleic acid-binding protein
LKLRESYSVAVAAGDALLHKGGARIERVNEGNFIRVWEVFQQYRDKEWSFTDCTSKVVMARLSITYAFAFDSHFEQ